MDTPKSINVRNRAPVGDMSPPSVDSKDPSTNASRGSAKEDHGEPGSCWNNQKFQEEYARAFEGLLDQKFSMGAFFTFSPTRPPRNAFADSSLAQYGDPLDPVIKSNGGD